jgi:uncharacterized protein with HEPN domain
MSPSPRDSAYLLDMLLSARLAQSYVAGKTRVEFDVDRQCQDAVVRRLEIIGEAAGHISPPTRATLATIPWRQITSMRNRMIHQYNQVDLDIVWDTVTRDLAALIAALQSYLPPVSDG